MRPRPFLNNMTPSVFPSRPAQGTRCFCSYIFAASMYK